LLRAAFFFARSTLQRSLKFQKFHQARRLFPVGTITPAPPRLSNGGIGPMYSK
jgi:hypothetical protein